MSTPSVNIAEPDAPHVAVTGTATTATKNVELAEGQKVQENQPQSQPRPTKKRRERSDIWKNEEPIVEDVKEEDDHDDEAADSDDDKEEHGTAVERQSAAFRTVRDAETERLLTGLRLLRLYFNKDQMQTPVLQYFKEHLPNLAHIGDVKNRNYEVQWKAMDENLHADGGNLHAYLLNQMSMAYPECNATMPSLGCGGLSTETVKTRILGSDALNIRKFNLEEPSDTRMPGFQESVQTPGAYNQRLSVGMTPKSRRVPKHGEMLLSVHGSPLGVYKEDNMEAIHESGEE